MTRPATSVSVLRVARALWFAVGISVVLGGSSHVSAQNSVEYGAVDAATVRVFAVHDVSAVMVAAQGGRRLVALPQMAHGTGFCIGNGLVFTAEHVVRGARHVVVSLPGDRGFVAARVLGRDVAHDIAVIEVGRRDLPTVSLAPADHRLRSRQNVFAVGYPLDATRRQAQSSRGIVSGALPDGRVQLDMDINPGNSGGPLIDDEDQVVGMVVAAGDVRQGVQGIGVAVPIAHLQSALTQTNQHLASRGAPGAVPGAESTARVVGGLYQAGILRVLREAADFAASATPPDTLTELTELAHIAQDPDSQVLLAAYLWDAAMMIMREEGDVVSLQAMPNNNNRRVAYELLHRAIGLVGRAYAADNNVASRSPFAGLARRSPLAESVALERRIRERNEVGNRRAERLYRSRHRNRRPAPMGFDRDRERAPRH